MRRALLLLVISPLVLSAAARPQAPPGLARIGVSPARVEIAIGPRPSTESIRVLNFGSEPVGVKVSVHTWDLDDDNRVRLLAPTEQSLDQWMVINPLEFTIEPGKSQTVRFSVRPRVEPEPGEHRAIIYFEQVDSPTEEQLESTFRTVFRLGVAIYGQVGEPERVARLHAVEVDGRAGWFDVSSEGSAHVRLGGQYAIWPAEAYPGSEETRPAERRSDNRLELPSGAVETGYLPTTPVLPGTRRRIQLPLPVEMTPGAYVLDLNASLAGDPLDRGIPFTVPEPPAADAAAAAPPVEPAD